MLNPGDRCIICGKTDAEIEREYLERKAAASVQSDRDVVQQHDQPRAGRGCDQG